MQPSQRLQSLDTMRGLTIMSMLMVNNPGDGRSVFEQLDHASWNGWTFTDLVFPSMAWNLPSARSQRAPLSNSARDSRHDRPRRVCAVAPFGIIAYGHDTGIAVCLCTAGRVAADRRSGCDALCSAGMGRQRRAFQTFCFGIRSPIMDRRRTTNNRSSIPAGHTRLGHERLERARR